MVDKFILRLPFFLRCTTAVMREEGDLGATNPRINRWLEGVETAINEGTLYGRKEDKSVSNNICTNFLNACY